jgi:hypothetical protein
MIINMEKVKCDNCDWEWNLSDGGDDPYTCHKCGHNNEPSVINEEVNRMRVMMGLQEQSVKDKLGNFWKNKVKPTAQKVGDAVQTGVHNASQKIADITKKPEQQQQTAPTTTGRNYEQLKAEWSKINADTTNMKGFGEGASKDMGNAKDIGLLNAKTAILKKMRKNQASFGYIIVDDATFKKQDGTYNYLVIIEPENID